MFAIENYIMRCNNSQATIFAYLREMILSCSAAIEEEVLESSPKYYYHGLLCCIQNLGSNIQVTFNNSNALAGNSAEESSLTLLFESVKQINPDTIFPLLQEAMFHNQTTAGKFEQVLG